MHSRYKYTGTGNTIYMPKECIEYKDSFISKYNRIDLEDLSCFLCGETNFEAISEHDRYGFYYPTAICQECGNIQQSAYYNETAITDFYKNYYRKIYSSKTPAELFMAQRLGHAKKIFNMISKFHKSKKVLEIGCGAGGVLSIFREHGCDVLGLDFDEEYLMYAEACGIKVKSGSLEVLHTDDKFDVIILSHVLEHITYPKEFLETATNFLTQEGVIYIEVPSVDSVANGSYHHDLLYYLQNAHTVHFTSNTLKMMCKSVGLTPIFSTNTIESCWQYSGAPQHLNQEELHDNLSQSKNLLDVIEIRRCKYEKSFKTIIRRKIILFLKIIRIEGQVRNIFEKLNNIYMQAQRFMALKFNSRNY